MNQYRIWDRVEERWLNETDKIFISLSGELYKHNFLSFIRRQKLNNRRYVIHQLIGKDEQDNPIYEGDIVELMIKDKTYLCLIVYIEDISSYALIECASKEHYYFTFYPDTKIKKLGNVLDDYQLIRNQEMFKAAKNNRRLEVSE